MYFAGDLRMTENVLFSDKMFSELEQRYIMIPQKNWYYSVFGFLGWFVGTILAITGISYVSLKQQVASQAENVAKIEAEKNAAEIRKLLKDLHFGGFVPAIHEDVKSENGDAELSHELMDNTTYLAICSTRAGKGLSSSLWVVDYKDGNIDISAIHFGPKKNLNESDGTQVVGVIPTLVAPLKGSKLHVKHYGQVAFGGNTNVTLIAAGRSSTPDAK